MFSQLIIFYLFLGGFGAGTLVFTLIIGWLPTPWFGISSLKSHARNAHLSALSPSAHLKTLHAHWGLIATLVALALGIIALFIDLGSRAPRFYFALNALGTSWLSGGALSLALLALLSLGLLLHQTNYLRLSSLAVTTIEILSLATALFVMFYTGAFLHSMGNAIPLWNTFALPTLFCLSSLSCGGAVHKLIAVYFAAPTSTVARFLTRCEVIILAIELLVACLFAWLAYGAQLFGTPTPSTAPLGTQLRQLFDPTLPQFFYAYLLVGLIIPLLVGLVEWTFSKSSHFPTTALSSTTLATASTRKLTAFAMTCVLVGAFCLRFAVVTDAYHPSFYSSEEKLAAQVVSESSLGYSEIATQSFSEFGSKGV